MKTSSNHKDTSCTTSGSAGQLSWELRLSLARIAASWRTDALLCAVLTLDATCPDCSRQGGVPHLLQVGQVQHRLHPTGRLRHACHIQKAGPQERPLDPVPRCLVSPGVGAWCHPGRVTPTAALVWQEEPSLPVTLLIRPGVCYPWSVACRWVGGVVMNCGAHQCPARGLGLPQERSRKHCRQPLL